jgi:hypothetical protein
MQICRRLGLSNRRKDNGETGNIMTKALATIALAALLLSSQNAFAGGSACDNLATAGSNDLLAIPQIAMTDGPWSPGVKCSSQGLSRAEDTCNEKTTIVRDRMLGYDRRLLIVRSTTSGKEPMDMDDILIFSCIAGQMKKVFDSFPAYMNGRIKIESAEPNKVILVAPQFPPGTNGGGRNVFDWNKRIQRYWLEGDDDSYVSTASSDTLSCSKLKTAKTETLIVLANGDFTDGDRDYPFTHGVGCYDAPADDPEHCEWQVDLVEDRMISANRRLIVLNSDHQGGVGSWGVVYVFGCVAGQLRTVLGGEFPYSASVEKVSADGLTVSTAREGRKDPRCCPRIEALNTYRWKDALQNDILDSVYYHPDPGAK